MLIRFLTTAVSFFALLIGPTISSASDDYVTREFDVLFRNGVVIDGSGEDRFNADVGIVGDKIAAIGDLSRAVGKREIDLDGDIIAPGFIDLHTHVTDGMYGRTGLLSRDPRRRAAANYVSQGITTVLGNPDGNQPNALKAQKKRLDALGIGPNVGLTNGHNGLRRIVMKKDQKRPATDEEIIAMRRIIDGDMAAGISFGMSIGSEYYSGRYSTPEEVVELSRGLSAYNGIAIAHMRSQGDAPMWYRPSRFRDIDPPSLDDAISEMLSVATEAGATTVLTHMKAWGSYRGRAQELIDRIETVRAKGARVYMDVYPYGSSGSDGDFSALPDWAFGLESEEASERMDYTAALRKTMSLAGKNVMGDLADDIMHQIGMRGGAKNILVLEYPNKEYVGKTFADVMEMTGKDEVDLVIALQLEGNRKKRGGGQFRSISMGQRDIETFLKQSWTATSTDGWVVLPEEAVGKKKYINTHRRCFGSFPRRLAYYSNIRKVDALETAVRSITSLPAEILSLTDRGLLRPGMKADIAAFDIDELSDTTTYLEPNRYPVGMSFVLVNGQFVVDQGERTFALPGKVLTR